jgi:NADPH:quinone reductase
MAPATKIGSSRRTAARDGRGGVKAVRCHGWCDPESLVFEEVASPPSGPEQVRIRVRAAGINFADSLMIGGTYQRKPTLPFTPGVEAAGEIIEIGAEVRGCRVGQRVLGYFHMAGAFGEEAVTGADAVVPIPDRMDFAAAAAFPIAYGTAHYALVHRAGLRPGETLLVLGAAGGAGLAAVETGKQLGARVIAAAGTQEKLAVAREHGADETIDYSAESIRDRVRALTGGRGADVVFDPVGGDAFDQAFRAVNFGARLIVIGFAGGRVQSVPANLVLVKGVSIVGVVWGTQWQQDPGLITGGLEEMLRWWEAGRLHPLVGKTFPLAAAGAAIRALLSRRYAGKIVLEA